MPKVEVIREFNFCHDGVRLTNYPLGAVCDMDDYSAGVAMREGWAKEVGAAPARPTGTQTGADSQPASSEPARRSRKPRAKKSKGSGE